MAGMDDTGRGTVAVASTGVREGARAGAPVHLPTWSRLNVAAKQSAPAGNGGDFFEVIQQRDGRVTVVMADVCGNGPSAAAPVSSLRWILRQTIARGETPGAVLAALNDWMVAQRIDDRFVTAVCVRIDAVTGARGGRQRRTPRSVRQARGRRRGGATARRGSRARDLAGADLSGDAPSSSSRRTRWSWSPTESPIGWPPPAISWESTRSWSVSRGRASDRRASAARCSARTRAPPRTPPSWSCKCRGAIAAPRRSRARAERHAAGRSGRGGRRLSATMGGDETRVDGDRSRALAGRRWRRARPRPPADHHLRRDRLSRPGHRRRRSDLALRIRTIDLARLLGDRRATRGRDLARRSAGRGHWRRGRDAPLRVWRNDARS